MSNPLRTLLLSIAMLAATAFGGAVHAEGEKSARGAMPQLELREHSQGQRAVDLLGARLPEVAAHYRKSATEFAATLRRDRTARIDRQGRLFHMEEFAVPAGATTAAAASTPGTTASYPLAQTFLLHSRPGASKVIYLDFNGHTTTGSVWNASYGVDPIVSPAFDLDGSPSTFSDVELDRIQKIWQRVAEDYAPFDVDVTTEEPPADLLTRTSSTDAQFGVRAVITRDFTAATAAPCGCGGFAYVGVFDYVGEYYKQAFIFFDRLGSGNEKYVAEAVSHEVGHTLGLSHDGTSTTAYYRGQGTGATGWAPIMGNGYYQPLTHWSKGEYADANNKEDDFAIILSNGISLRADDHGNTIATATQLVGTSAAGQTSYAAQGVISTPTDVDVFSFASGPGLVTIAINPALRSPNLDVIAQILDGNGQVVATSNPLGALNATFSVTLAQGGTYFLTVNGIGEGDPLVTGYSDYGSVGEYAIAATVPTPGGVPPVSVPTASVVSGTAPLSVNLSGTGSYDPDGSVVGWVWNFGDGSATVSGATTSHVFSAAGTYAATLTVTDNAGYTNSKAVSIQVGAPPVITPVMFVQSITVTIASSSGRSQATAAVTVVDGSGNKVVGATVSGSWSGATTGTASAISGSTGVALVKSNRIRGTGTFRFTIGSISLSGYTYSASKNLESTDFAAN